MFQLFEDQTAERVVVVVVVEVLHVEMGQKIVERELAVDQQAAVLARDDFLFLARFGHRAEQCLDDVLERDDTFDAAELVGHQAVPAAGAAHQVERVVHAQVLGYVLRGAHHLRQRESGFVEPAEQVLEVDYSDDRVEVAVGYGVGVEQVVLDDVLDLVAGGVRVEPYHVAAVGHDRSDVAIAQVEHAFDDVLLDLFDLAFGGAFLNDRLDLFLGYPVSVDRIDTQYAKHAGRAFRQQPDERQRDLRQQAHRPRHDLGYAFRGAHADSLGNQLAQNQRQISDRDYDDYLSDRHRMRLERWNSREHFPEALGQHVARVDTRQDTDQRDSDLNRGEKNVRIAREFQRGLGGPASALGVGFEPRLAGRDHRDFRHRQDSVEQNQPDDDENFHVWRLVWRLR